MLDPGDVTSLKVYVDDNAIVWYSASVGTPLCSELPPAGFLTLPVSRADHVRMIGHARNAQLILAYHTMFTQAQAGKLEVCTPLICETNRMQHSPVHSLLAMRSCRLSSSVGGWHRFQNDDHVVYSLLPYIDRVGERIDDSGILKLKQSAAWAGLSFIPHLDLCATTRLVATILDPRWYVDTYNPQRCSKLWAFLGLTASNFHALFDEGYSNPIRRGSLARLVNDCWQTQPCGNEDLARPEYFLWRIWRAKGANWKGTLRASQALVAFLRHTWLDSIYRKTTNESLFVPAQFFANKAEADAYTEHAAAFWAPKKGEQYGQDEPAG